MYAADTINLSSIAILNIKGSDYCSINSGISISEAINLMQNIDLTEKSEHYKDLLKLKIRNMFSSCKFTSSSNIKQKK